MSDATTAPSGAGFVMWCASDPSAHPASSATGVAPRARADVGALEHEEAGPLAQARPAPAAVERAARLDVEGAERVEAR